MLLEYRISKNKKGILRNRYAGSVQNHKQARTSKDFQIMVSTENS